MIALLSSFSRIAVTEPLSRLPAFRQASPHMADRVDVVAAEPDEHSSGLRLAPPQRSTGGLCLALVTFVHLCSQSPDGVLVSSVRNHDALLALLNFACTCSFPVSGFAFSGAQKRRRGKPGTLCSPTRSLPSWLLGSIVALCLRCMVFLLSCFIALYRWAEFFG